MDEKLLNQTRLLKKYINLLEKVAHTEKNVFLKDEILTAAAERYLQLAIETCINIGNRIIALE
ncbi:HepT-like ribonuclease domain-containing protein [Carboxydocella sp. JDF658]|uniref:HepT-like ribonuclease domain-containing protein n=1 Tax=Carboxydocella sp. JDF658 TaxID=1926600 RepID=UPI0009AC6888|nr:HepT-like ribonuclease domain-containing protein [Carboxydocella sp. JDF658]